MKTISQLVCCGSLILLTSCNIGIGKSDKNKVAEHLENSNINNQRSVLIKDSISPQKVPTSQDIYSMDDQRSEIIGELRHNPLTKKTDYNFKLNDSGVEVNVTLYFIKKRIVSLEKRIYDINNTELAYSMFDFDENNDCLSNTKMVIKEKMSYSYAKYGNSVIKYDVNSNLIEITDNEKQQIIQSTKVSLDSIMQHFPDFNYTINWK